MTDTKLYLVETQATVIRHYYVRAKDQKEAEELSCNMSAIHEEDVDENTMEIVELPNDH